MNKYLAAYLAGAAVMIVLDMLWLGAIATKMYQQAIGHLMAEKPSIPAAAAFYVLYAAGVVAFVVAPRAADSAWGPTVLMGAFFGLVAYGTYDLSNLATLKNWPLRLALVDMAWGATATAAAAGAGKLAMGWATKV